MRAAFSSLALVVALSVAKPALADAWDSAMAAGALAKEKALDSNSASDWYEALDHFLEADALRETKESKYELAVAASHVKADDLAVDAYEQAIALGLDGPPREKAEAFVSEHLPAMARVKLEGPKGATVLIAGRRRAVLPMSRPIVVFSGTTLLRIVSADGVAVEETVTIPAGETKQLDIGPRFAPKPAPPPPSPRPLPTRPEAPPSSSGRTLAWTATIGGAAFVALGATFYFVAQKTINDRRIDLDTHCQTRLATDPDQCLEVYYGDDANVNKVQHASDDILTFKAVRTASILTMGVGVVAAAFGVGWLSAHPNAPTVSAAPTKGGVAFTLSAAF